MQISIIQPSRNNLKYLKWSYDSIRKNQGNHDVQICVADDFSDDGTWEWCEEIMQTDSNFDAIRNEGPTRLGHTILYDRLVNEVARYDYCMIFHADMYLAPGALDSLSTYLAKGRVVSLTRVEPPLHPDGPEKVLKDFGTEPENFNERSFLSWLELEYKPKHNKDTTVGVFAPWAFHKKNFQEVGGHDRLYAPQSKEDTDLFNRFQLNGIKFIQTWRGLVYHMTCRGSRFNPTLTKVGTASDEWTAQNIKSSRNFIRKWGHYVKHDEFMNPVIPSKYKIYIKLQHCNDLKYIAALEPWCDVLYTDFADVDKYIEQEQSNTLFNLKERLQSTSKIPEGEGILVIVDCDNFGDDEYLVIQELSSILSNNPDLGEYTVGSLIIKVNDLTTYEKELIHINNNN
jgi:glycosyltransferase involved in cell wall biosynthesis